MQSTPGTIARCESYRKADFRPRGRRSCSHVFSRHGTGTLDSSWQRGEGAALKKAACPAVGWEWQVTSSASKSGGTTFLESGTCRPGTQGTELMCRGASLGLCGSACRLIHTNKLLGKTPKVDHNSRCNDTGRLPPPVNYGELPRQAVEEGSSIFHI